MATLKYRLKDAIAANNLNDTFELLRQALKKDPVRYNELLLLESRYFELETNINQDTMPKEFVQIEMNRVRRSLMGLVDKLGDINIHGNLAPSNTLTINLEGHNHHSLWDRIVHFFKKLF